MFYENHQAVTRAVAETHYVPVTESRQVPVETVSYVPEQRVRTIPVTTTVMVPQQEATTVPVTAYRDVPQQVVENVPVTTYQSVPQQMVRTVPVTTTVMVPVPQTQIVPTTRVRLVNETATRQVPVTAAERVTVTLMRTVARQVPRQVATQQVVMVPGDPGPGTDGTGEPATVIRSVRKRTSRGVVPRSGHAFLLFRRPAIGLREATASYRTRDIRRSEEQEWLAPQGSRGMAAPAAVARPTYGLRPLLQLRG